MAALEEEVHDELGGYKAIRAERVRSLYVQETLNKLLSDRKTKLLKEIGPASTLTVAFRRAPRAKNVMERFTLSISTD